MPILIDSRFKNLRKDCHASPMTLPSFWHCKKINETENKTELSTKAQRKHQELSQLKLFPLVSSDAWGDFRA